MADQDDLLKPEDIDALLSAAGLTGPSPDPPRPTAKPPTTAPPPSGELLDPQEIESLLRQQHEPTGAHRPGGSTERLLQQAEENLAAAVAPQLKPPRGIPAELGSLESFSFQDFGGRDTADGAGLPLDALDDVELDLRIELGRTELLIDEVLKLKEGSVVPLDKLAGDPVDILVNGRLIARGEVLVLNDNFCVRIAEILSPEL